MVRLYHFTARQGIPGLLAAGFTGNAVWLSPHPETVSGEHGRSGMIEVTLGLGPEQLDAHRRNVKEEVWDESLGNFVPDEEATPYFWYEIPAEVVNRLGRLREVMPEERKRLMGE